MKGSTSCPAQSQQRPVARFPNELAAPLGSGSTCSQTGRWWCTWSERCLGAELHGHQQRERDRPLRQRATPQRLHWRPGPLSRACLPDSCSLNRTPGGKQGLRVTALREFDLSTAPPAVPPWRSPGDALHGQGVRASKPQRLSVVAFEDSGEALNYRNLTSEETGLPAGTLQAQSKLVAPTGWDSWAASRHAAPRCGAHCCCSVERGVDDVPPRWALCSSGELRRQTTVVRGTPACRLMMTHATPRAAVAAATPSRGLVRRKPRPRTCTCWCTTRRRGHLRACLRPSCCLPHQQHRTTRTTRTTLFRAPRPSPAPPAASRRRSTRTRSCTAITRRCRRCQRPRWSPSSRRTLPKAAWWRTGAARRPSQGPPRRALTWSCSARWRACTRSTGTHAAPARCAKWDAFLPWAPFLLACRGFLRKPTGVRHMAHSTLRAVRPPANAAERTPLLSPPRCAARHPPLRRAPRAVRRAGGGAGAPGAGERRRRALWGRRRAAAGDAG